MMWRPSTWLVFLSVLALTGCGESSSRSELNRFVEQEKAKPATPVDPVPKALPHNGFVYTASMTRSPFLPFEGMLEEVGGQFAGGISPDPDRPREILENFPLDALNMLGTVEMHGTRWALVQDAEGLVHRVKKGDHLGKNHGKIKEIEEGYIAITEIIPDIGQAWRERDAKLMLAE